MRSDNFAARAARWSAAHRKTAVLGWVAFVIGAFALGNAVGLVTMKHEDQGSGESRAAERVLAKEFPTERAAENVLIQNPLRAVGHAGSGRRDPRRRGAAVAHRRRDPPQSPLNPANASQISATATRRS